MQMASKAVVATETVLDPDTGRVFRKGKFLGKVLITCKLSSQ